MFVLSIDYQKYNSFLKFFNDVFFINVLPSLGKFIPYSLDVITELIIIHHTITSTHKNGGLHQGPTCTQELGSTSAVCAPILPGEICSAGSLTFRGNPAFRGEAAIFAPVTEQVGTARNTGNT